MAKTKQDYIVEGAKLFKDGKDRPDGSSWQAKATQEGWDCAFTDKQDVILAREEYNKKIDNYEDLGYLNILEEQNNRSNNIIHPALMHIEFLKDKAFNEPNGNKFIRYISKYSKLQKKWSKRGVVF